MAFGLVNFIRRNIIAVLAVPPLVAAGTGLYVRVMRSDRPVPDTHDDKAMITERQDEMTKD